MKCPICYTQININSLLKIQSENIENKERNKNDIIINEKMFDSTKHEKIKIDVKNYKNDDPKLYDMDTLNFESVSYGFSCRFIRINKVD